jgi:mono/diheme cytochrome c family protein
VNSFTRKHFVSLVSMPVLVCLLFALRAASHPPRSSKETHHLTFAAAPPSYAALKNPYDGQHDAVLAGAKMFRRYCAECHGADAHGIGKAPSLRSEHLQDARPGELFWFLRNGKIRSGMPSWSGLPDQRRWQLVTYLKSLQ